MPPRAPYATLASWNVLAQAYCKPERYAYVTGDGLDKELRTVRVQTQLLRLVNDNDAVCVQELEEDVLLQLRDEVASIHYAKHQSRPDGVAILSKHKFSTSRVLRNDGFAAAVATLDLKDQELNVAALHLPWTQDARRGAHILSAVISALPPGPTVLGMDANAPSASPVGDVLRARGYRTHQDLASGYQNDSWSAIDRIATTWAPPHVHTLPVTGLIPNSSWPSDHKALVATLTSPSQST